MEIVKDSLYVCEFFLKSNYNTWKYNMANTLSSINQLHETEPRWFAIYSAFKKEKFAKKLLEKKGIETAIIKDRNKAGTKERGKEGRKGRVQKGSKTWGKERSCKIVKERDQSWSCERSCEREKGRNKERVEKRRKRGEVEYWRKRGNKKVTKIVV